MTDPSELTNDALLQELHHRVKSGFITIAAMTDPSEPTNDALLQELHHRVKSGFITMRVESMMAGRGVGMSLSTTHPEYGGVSCGVSAGSSTSYRCAWMSTPISMSTINIKCTFRRPFGKLLFGIHYFTGINFPFGWVMKTRVIK